MKNKVLVIAYYWPPSGGSGVQRWVKFVKYLPQFNIVPHVYTPLNPDFPIKDKTLEQEIPSEAVIIKRKIIEPYSFYRFFAGQKNSKNANFGMSKSKSNSLKNKLAIWVRGNLLIPDPRKFWIKPSYRFLKKYIKKNNICTIITTGPPHSMHLIGRKLKRKMGKEIKWIADFRDPWTQVYYKDDLKQSNWAKNKLFQMERTVIQECDEFITVSDHICAEFNKMHNTSKGSVIYNGFDERDFNFEVTPDTEKFVISHVGKLPHFSNPENFWRALKSILTTNIEIQNRLLIRFVGTVDKEVRDSIEQNGLTKYCEFVGVVNHEKAITYMKKANLLILPVPNVKNSKGILTGKLFEYLASQTHILSFSDPDGNLNKILEDANAGKNYSYSASTEIELFLKTYLIEKSEDDTRILNEKIKQFERRELTKRLAQLL